ncbi:MAG: dTMP kinase [bacterium]|nr:dTMP kinase [bacterium]
MIPNPYPGIFIVIDGIDGCGKSTQVKKLVDWLQSVIKNREILQTKEPNKNGPFGKMIYADLARRDGLHLDQPDRFQMWYACDSKVHLQEKIIPCLQSGGIVVSDRFRSSMVYGVRHPEDLEKLMAMNQMIIGEHFIWPDVIFVIDVPPAIAIERLQKKGVQLDGHERSSVLSRTQGYYHQFAGRYPNCVIVEHEGDPSPEAKFGVISRYCYALLEKKTYYGV